LIVTNAMHVFYLLNCWLTAMVHSGRLGKL